MPERAPNDFHLEEFRQLKREVMYYIQNSYRAIWLSIVAVAAVYHAIFAGQLSSVPGKEFARWVPFAISLCGGLVALASYGFVGLYGKYLVKIEEEFGLPELGWQKFKQKRFLGPVLIICWVLFILANLYAAFRLRAFWG